MGKVLSPSPETWGVDKPLCLFVAIICSVSLQRKGDVRLVNRHKQI